MSYLSSLRLHFAGRFQANVSTVNNDASNFFNEAFQPSAQDAGGPNYNPQGDAAFRLLGCKVTAAWLPSGKVGSSDPVLECIVADSDSQVPAKLVDLDPQQQMVSEIWGLQVRIADAKGSTLLSGDFEPAAFMDIWDRASGGGEDWAAGAIYQSVLKNLRWDDVSRSPFLTRLKKAAAGGLLSIKFNLDRFNLNNTSPDFTTGRIIGTIGPAAASEPQHLVLGRHFIATACNDGGYFVPAGGINHCVALVDTRASCIFLDLGNALPASGETGAPVDLGELTLGVYDTTAGIPFAANAVTTLGTISGYASNDWYAKTAGVVALPLTRAQLKSIAAAPLVLRSTRAAFISENGGNYVAADTFVHRLSPGDTAGIDFYLTQWGQPLPNATVQFCFDPSGLQPGPPPPVGVPQAALQFNGTAATDADGIAVLRIKALDPGSPRNFKNGGYGIDGQIYGIRALYGGGPIDEANFVSILLWSGFTPSYPVTWNDIAPTMVQYANLYPVMRRFLNLGDYDSVVANARLLALAFSLDVSDPNSMPVTRDLSPAKRKAILSFLANPQRGKRRIRKGSTS